MTNHIYRSHFSNELQSFISFKRNLGYKYEIQRFREIDTYFYEQGIKELTKNNVLGWCQKRNYEKHANLCTRVDAMRQFTLYMERIGKRVYVVPKKYLKSPPKYQPYIFTDNELRAFFTVVDNCKYNYAYPYRQAMMPIIFRLLYGTGLRISEACNLRIKDIDFENGILKIIDSKFHKDRLVPVTNILNQRMQYFLKVAHSFSLPEEIFFLLKKGSPANSENMYSSFRSFLWEAKIPHRGRGKGPRLHDFRHNFSVKCLSKWVKEGKDLTAYLPILSTYLGHQSYQETAYYLKLTADLYPDIIFTIENSYKNLIPVIRGDFE